MLGLGKLSAGFIVLLGGTYLVYRLLRQISERSQSCLTMPTLTPIPIPTRGRSLLERLVAWLHDVRKWEVAKNWEYTLPTTETRIVIHGGFQFDGASIPKFL